MLSAPHTRIWQPIASLWPSVQPRHTFHHCRTLSVPDIELRDEVESKRAKSGSSQSWRDDSPHDQTSERHEELPPRDGLCEGPKETVRRAEESAPNRPSLGVVGVQKLRDRPSPGHGCKLPTQVPCVLNAGIHTLSAHRAVDVRCVTGEQDTALLIARSLTMMQLEPCQPCGISQAHRTKCRIGDHGLKFGKRQVVRRDVVSGT